MLATFSVVLDKVTYLKRYIISVSRYRKYSETSSIRKFCCEIQFPASNVDKSIFLARLFLSTVGKHCRP